MKARKAIASTSQLHSRYKQDQERHQQKIDQAIWRYSHAHMSNAKWRKAFRILYSIEPPLTRCLWKFVADERVFSTGVPREEDLLDTHLADGRFQPEFVYREIEWVEIPAQYQIDDTGDAPQIVHQKVSVVLEALNKAGKFPVALPESGLLLYGYS